jgi:hypothetical protein
VVVLTLSLRPSWLLNVEDLMFTEVIIGSVVCLSGSGGFEVVKSASISKIIYASLSGEFLIFSVKVLRCVRSLILYVYDPISNLPWVE